MTMMMMMMMGERQAEREVINQCNAKQQYFSKKRVVYELRHLLIFFKKE
jgi:hypothetical protein